MSNPRVPYQMASDRVRLPPPQPDKPFPTSGGTTGGLDQSARQEKNRTNKTSGNNSLNKFIQVSQSH